MLAQRHAGFHLQSASVELHADLLVLPAQQLIPGNRLPADKKDNQRKAHAEDQENTVIY